MELFDNPRRVPYPQWGGSAQYATRLTAMLPMHDVYVEPFCGAAALFFAKEPARREVLADLDSDVTFAMRYIQTLTTRKLEALKGFPWIVSRRAHRQAQATAPETPAQRIWKHIYCRMATWGAKPTCRGYSTINDGDVYNLEELWRFRERLRDATILSQDWKQTLRQFDKPAALFFIDPPYIEEWNISEGISPEEIAEEVCQTEGPLPNRLYRLKASTSSVSKLRTSILAANHGDKAARCIQAGHQAVREVMGASAAYTRRGG